MLASTRVRSTSFLVAFAVALGLQAGFSLPSSAAPQVAGQAVAATTPASTPSTTQGEVSQILPTAAPTWAVGGSTGEFTWSYPIDVPPVPGALAPDLAIDYASGSTDGGVSNITNQASWIGEGFELGAAFIERAYVPCSQDKTGGTNATTTGDLCWFSDSQVTNDQKWDNATLMMGGRGRDLVRVGNTAEWRLKDDDGTRVTKIGTVASNTEYWRVTTPDGTQYYFGKGKSGTSSAPYTSSRWRVPVAANQPGEPGYTAAFKDSFQSQAWRWNLDYVVSPTGTSMTYYYVRETNKYKVNLATSTSYDRGGYLAKIQYGERASAETPDASPAKVTFVVEERCDTALSSTCLTATPTSLTAKAWPDVPMSSVCDASYCPAQKTSPTFFSRKRLKQINTFTRTSDGTGWSAVDTWDLGKSFPRPAAGGAAPSLWLASIKHTGKAGTAISLPATKLSPIMLASRISGTPMEKPRLGIITSETGTETGVEYSHPECTQTTVPTAADIPTNTKRCMPLFFTNGTSAPTLQWFNKYVVTQVIQRDPTAVTDLNHSTLGLDISADLVTNYTYSGGGAWRYDASPLVPTNYRTWSQWRGYGKVTTKVGLGSVKETTENLYFRGMHGDRATASGGSTTVSVTDSTGATWRDDDWLAGTVRETRRLNGATADSGTIVDPRAVASPFDADGNGRTTARQVTTAETRTRQVITGGVRQGRETVLAWDKHGQPTQVESSGDNAVTGDETCVRTTFATPTVTSTGPIDRVAETSTMPALCGVPASDNDLIEGTRHFYGTQPLGTVSGAGLEARRDQLTGSGSARAWSTMSQAEYDSWGRVTKATDALGKVTTHSSTHTVGRLLTTRTTTSPDPDGTGPATPLVTQTSFDTRRGAAIKTVEPGGQITESTLDALGRTISVWNPGQAKASQAASVTYGYQVNVTKPSTITTRRLLPNGASYSTTVTFLDSLLRTRQVQTPAAVAGRLVEDSRYDSRGHAVLVDNYHNSSAPTTTLVLPTSRTSILRSHRFAFDFAGRQIRDALYSAEVLKWQTTTAYTGDRVQVTPPSGGTPTTTVSDIVGRTVELRQHLGTTTAASAATTRYSYDKAGNLAGIQDAAGNQWSYTYDLAGNRLASDDPDRGASSMTYDLAGRLASTTDARGVTLRYVHDALGRPTRTTKADGTTTLTSTVWDTVKKGLVTSTSRHVQGSVITTRVDSYDAAGRPTRRTTIVPSIGGVIPAELAGSYTTTTGYNPDGSVRAVGLPSAGPLPAESLLYGYTVSGLPDTVTGTIGTTQATYVTDTQYLQEGPVSAVLLGTHTGKAVMASYGRDMATLRLTGLNLNRQVNAGASDESTVLSYNPAGLVTQVVSTVPGGVDRQCFSYDHQQQLVEAWTPAGGCDAATRSQGSLGGPQPYWSSWTVGTTGKVTSRTDRTATTSSTTAFTFDDADGGGSVRPHFVIGASTSGSVDADRVYAADESGNTISRSGPDGGVQELVWDDQQRLVEVSQGGDVTARMVDDASGSQLVRREGSTTTLYLGDTELTWDGVALSAKRYYSLGGQAWAVRTGTSNDTVTSLIPDLQGATHHQVANATGVLTTVWREPYGQVRGSVPTSLGATGLIRVGVREYDPFLQRFVSPESIQDVSDPFTLNPYLDANNSPVTVQER